MRHDAMKHAFCLAAALLAVSACTQRARPTELAPAFITAASPGADLFQQKCAMCHRSGGMGALLLARRLDPSLAPLETRDDLTADDVTRIVRDGMGNMPRLSRGEVSDADLAAIARYLTTAKPVETQ